MTIVFLLFHTHDLGEGETDDKLIGVYASLADAQQAHARTAVLEGLRDAPEGFVIDPYEIGMDHWSGLRHSHNGAASSTWGSRLIRDPMSASHPFATIPPVLTAPLPAPAA